MFPPKYNYPSIRRNNGGIVFSISIYCGLLSWECFHVKNRWIHFVWENFGRHGTLPYKKSQNNETSGKFTCVAHMKFMGAQMWVGFREISSKVLKRNWKQGFKSGKKRLFYKKKLKILTEIRFCLDLKASPGVLSSLMASFHVINWNCGPET